MRPQTYRSGTAGTSRASKWNKGAATREIFELLGLLAVGVDMICNRNGLNKLGGLLFSISFLAMLLCAAPENAAAQAAPGPIGPPESIDGAKSEVPPAPPPKPVRKPIGGHPNLSGAWNLNRDDSDNAQQKVRAASESSTMGDPHHGGWGNNGPFGYPGGPGGGYPGGGYPGGSRPTNGKDIPDPSIGLSRLTVDQTATSAVVMDDSGETIANYSAPDSSANSSSGNPNTSGGTGAANGGETSSSNSSSSTNSSTTKGAPIVSAQWKGNQFITVRQETTGSKTKTTRTYELSSDGSQLNVTTKLEGKQYKQPVTFLLVYDPDTSNE
jgi:hypothetical protein